MIQKILDKLGVKYEELSHSEKETFKEYDVVLSAPEIEIKDIGRFIADQRLSISKQLSSYKNSKDKDLFLKARMRNIDLLEAFIVTPADNKTRLLTELKNRFKIKD